jgi:hypothetical protein
MQAELAAFFMKHHFYLKEQLADKLIIQIWMFGRHFFKNEQCETVTSRKTTVSICCQ